MYARSEKLVLLEYMNEVYIPQCTPKWGHELTINDVQLAYPLWHALSGCLLDKAIAWKQTKNIQEKES